MSVSLGTIKTCEDSNGIMNLHAAAVGGEGGALSCVQVQNL